MTRIKFGNGGRPWMSSLVWYVLCSTSTTLTGRECNCVKIGPLLPVSRDYTELTKLKTFKVCERKILGYSCSFMAQINIFGYSAARNHIFYTISEKSFRFKQVLHHEEADFFGLPIS